MPNAPFPQRLSHIWGKEYRARSYGNFCFNFQTVLMVTRWSQFLYRVYNLKWTSCYSTLIHTLVYFFQILIQSMGFLCNV